jgi:hypothetical protein
MCHVPAVTTHRNSLCHEPEAEPCELAQVLGSEISEDPVDGVNVLNLGLPTSKKGARPIEPVLLSSSRRPGRQRHESWFFGSAPAGSYTCRLSPAASMSLETTKFRPPEPSLDAKRMPLAPAAITSSART